MTSDLMSAPQPRSLRRTAIVGGLVAIVAMQVVAFLLLRESAGETDAAGLVPPQEALAQPHAGAVALGGTGTPTPPAVAEAKISFADSEEDEEDEGEADRKKGKKSKAKALPTRAMFSVNPAGAKLFLDGVDITGTKGLKVTPGPHRLVVSRDGYDSTAVPFSAKKGRTTKVAVVLKAKPVVAAAPAAPESDTPAAEAELAPPPPAAPPPSPPPAKVERVARRQSAATPRVPKNMKGNARKGKRVAGGSCSRCHGVSASMYSRAQWSQFFASGRHDRYQRLGQKVSRSELAAVKSYLMKNAADAPKNQGAGIR